MEKDSRKVFGCGICEKSFIRHANKKKHIAVVHGEEKKYVCNVCSSSFGFKNELTSHRENNHQGGRHTCKSCDKIFASTGSLKEHIKKIHEGQQNHKCDYCGKSFTQSRYLKTHIQTLHEAQRNYKCDSCGKYSFSEICCSLR